MRSCSSSSIPRIDELRGVEEKGAHASPTLAITTRLVTITASLKPSSSSNDYESPPFSPTDDDSEPSRTNNDSNPKPTGTGSNDKPTSSGGSPPSATSTGTAPDASSSIVPQDLLDVLLKTHNDFRVLHQVDPLGWNDTLAESSDRWVDNCVWEHSGGKLLEGGYGENLFGELGDSLRNPSEELTNGQRCRLQALLGRTRRKIHPLMGKQESTRGQIFFRFRLSVPSITDSV